MAKFIRYPTGFGSALLLLFLIPLIAAPGSQVQAQTGNPPPQELIVHPDGVVHVMTLPLPGPEAPVPREMPFMVPDPEALQQRKEQLQSGGSDGLGSSLSAEPGLAPSIGQSFIGLRKAESCNCVPPDTQVAAGPNHIFEAVNVQGRILTKIGSIVSTFSLNTFFGEPSTTSMFDPKIRFDLQSQRWFVAMITANSAFSAGTWRLAVSTSDDPTGTFVRYTVTPTGNVPDFPGLGINDDKVILTANAFNPSFLGTEFVVFNKSQLVAGTSVNTQFFPPNQGVFTIQPAHSLSSTTTLFMAAVSFDFATFMRIWSLTGVPGVGSGATFTTVDRTINTLTSPPDAVQQGTSTLIATNDNRLLDAVFRNGSLWVTANAACTPSGDTSTRACLRFIQVLTGSLTLNQDFNFGTSQTYYYFPAIQTDSANNLITGFSRSSASEFASVYASGRLAGDPLNTLQPTVLLHAGEAPYTPFANRWGDYSGAGIDPSDQGSVWVAGEYARVEGGSEWGTWIAQLRFGQLTADVCLQAGPKFGLNIGVAGDAIIVNGFRAAPPKAVALTGTGFANPDGSVVLGWTEQYDWGSGTWTHPVGDTVVNITSTGSIAFDTTYLGNGSPVNNKGTGTVIPCSSLSSSAGESMNAQ